MPAGGSYRKGSYVTVTGYTDGTSFYQAVIEHGKPAFVSHDYLHEISEGIITNHTPVWRVGQVSSADATEKDFTTINAITRIPTPAATELLKVVSTSSQDAPGGTGAHLIEIHGLDASGDQISEVCTMNGLTKITTSNTYWRINDSHVMSNGTNYANVGELSIQSSGGTIFRNILAGNNNDLNVHYTIPRSYNGFITGWSGGGLTGNTTTKGEIRLKTTTDPSDRLANTDVDYIERIIEFNNDTTVQQFRIDLKTVGLSTVRATIKRSEGASTVTGNVGIEMYLDPDDLGL